MLEATESGVGLELIQFKSAEILFNQLNAEIDIQDEKWQSRDKNWDNLTGQDIGEVRLEHVEEKNFHLGHRPSLVEAPPQEDYPNVSVMAYQGRPSTSIVDQASNFQVTLDIELMVKAESEPEADRRIHRTAEAVHQVFVKNPRLDGYSLGWDNDPIVNITDVFIRNEEHGYGKKWYWQACRIRYSLTRHNVLPE